METYNNAIVDQVKIKCSEEINENTFQEQQRILDSYKFLDKKEMKSLIHEEGIYARRHSSISSISDDSDDDEEEDLSADNDENFHLKNSFFDFF